MKFDRQAAIQEIDEALDFNPGMGGDEAVTQIGAVRKACIERLAPPGSSFRKMSDPIDAFGEVGDNPWVKLQAVLVALRRAYEKDHLQTFEELVHATLFDDLLEQAAHQLHEGYLLPATVIIGAVLEEHLRKLALKNISAISGTSSASGTQDPKKASVLNDELAKAKAYSQPEWRQVQAWLDLRNEAAHGKAEFQTRTTGDIERLLSGVREFMIRHAA